MHRVFLKTELENPLRQLALELMLALSDNALVKGRIDLVCSNDEYSFLYSGALQAVGLMTACEDVSMLSITDDRFCLILDKNDTGVELSYLPLEEPELKIYAEIVKLSEKILTHLEAMQAE